MRNRSTISRLQLRTTCACAAILLAAVASSSCDDQGTNPSSEPARIDYFSGDGQQGLVNIPLDEKLVVRVRDAAGHPVENARVHWSTSPGSGAISPSQTLSDRNGIARASWTLGAEHGQHTAIATVSGLQAAIFSAVASDLGATCESSPLDLPVGGSITLAGRSVADICLESSTFFARDYLAMTFNTARAPDSDIDVNILAMGMVTPVGPPLPAMSDLPGAAASMQQPPKELRRDNSFHASLRVREARELAPLRLPVGGTQSSQQAAQLPAYSLAAPTLGETFTLNANATSSCAIPINRTGRVVAISDHAIVVEDTGNPAGGFTPAEYLELARTFDTLIYPVHTDNFGETSDIDRNGRTVLFYSVEVNKLTPPGAGGGTVTGFFFARDLYPKVGNSRLGSCANSNESEIVYLMVPDPNGTINGNQRGKALVEQLTIATIAHEYQHLINASRRMHVNVGAVFPEAVWLDEALAHSAEELVFYRAVHLVPMQNISALMIEGSPAKMDAYTHFQMENVERLRFFLGGTNDNWAYTSAPPGLAARGAATWFLRYAVDRIGGDHGKSWRSLVAGPDTGMRNLERVIEADPVNWMRDWSVALYADDVVHYTQLKHQVSSWMTRSIVNNVGENRLYPLLVRTMLDNVVETATMKAGGSLYFRFAVPPNGRVWLRAAPEGANADAFSIVLLRTQ